MRSLKSAKHKIQKMWNVRYGEIDEMGKVNFLPRGDEITVIAGNMDNAKAKALEILKEAGHLDPNIEVVAIGYIGTAQ